MLRFQPGDVGQILRPCGSFFIRNEVIPADYRDTDALKLNRDTSWICVLELDSVDFSHNIDSPGSDADLKSNAGFGKIVFLYVRGWSAEPAQGRQDALRIFIGAPHP